MGKGRNSTLFTISHEHLASQTSLRTDFIQQSLFVVPFNDGEAARCCQILRALGAPHLHVSKQSWGATLDKEWDKLRIETYDPRLIKNIVIVEIPGVSQQRNEPIPSEVRLRELGFHLEIIDHHHYQWVDRFQPKSSLEQLCELIGWKMNDDDMLIAINDRSYIPGLKSLGINIDLIRRIRMFDLVSQGNSPQYIDKQIKLARELIPQLAYRKRGDLWILDESRVKQPYLVQELSLDEPSGLIQAFEIKSHKVGFSGSPEIVNQLLTFDHSPWEPNLGTLLAYAGGDNTSSKYWALKAINKKSKPLPDALISEIQNLILQAMKQSQSHPNLKS